MVILKIIYPEARRGFAVKIGKFAGMKALERKIMDFLFKR